MSKATYYLLRQRVDFDNAVAICRDYLARSSGTARQELELVQGENQAFRMIGFHRRRVFGQAGWVKFLENSFGIDIEESGGAADDAMVVVQFSDRIWVLSFGALHGISTRLPLERRFGVVAVSNASTPEEVRQIAAHSHGASSMYRLERRGKRGSLTEFLVSRLARRASKIASKVIDDVDRPLIIEGGLGVYFTAPDSGESLEANLARMLGWWNEGQHIHDALRQLDKVRDAEDEASIAERDAELHELILAQSDQLGVWCDGEEFYKCDSLQIKYPRTLPGLRRDASARRRLISIPLNSLDTTDLVAGYRSIYEADPDGLGEAVVIGRDDENRTHERNLRHFFTTEITVGNEIWVHEEGGWSIVEPRHRDTVKHVVLTECRGSQGIVQQWGVDLIDFAHADEQAYNRSLAGANAHLGAVFLDEPGGRLDYHGSTVELGDVFIPHGQHGMLLHVKLETTFGPVSKVCEQAGRAAELLAADPEFRLAAELFLSAKAGRAVSLTNNKRFYWGVCIVLRRPRPFPGSLKYRAEECIHDFIHKIAASGYEPLVMSVKRD